MTREQITERIAELLGTIAPEVELDSVDASEPLQQALDIDSFDFLNLLVAIRDELGVTIEEADYSKVSTLADMVSFLDDALS